MEERSLGVSSVEVNSAACSLFHAMLCLSLCELQFAFRHNILQSNSATHSYDPTPSQTPLPSLKRASSPKQLPVFSSRSSKQTATRRSLQLHWLHIPMPNTHNRRSPYTLPLPVSPSFFLSSSLKNKIPSKRYSTARLHLLAS